MEKIANEAIIPEWILCEGWNKKHLHLCLDSLSLDRHRSFQKRLMKLPVNFKKACQQGIVFRKALQRAIEVPEPLHQAFHVLQCACNLHNSLLKWCGKVAGWKKIKYGEVSQSFHLCRQLLFIVLEEFERLSWDKFLCAHDEDMKVIMENEISANIVKDVAKLYDSFCLVQMSDDASNCMKCMHDFMRLANKLKLFWKACKSGDCIMQECIIIEFLGVFHLLNKNKYFEIGLAQIEREYGEINFSLLQEIRLNMAFRYQPEGVTDASLHVLNKVMENINGWCKSLPLGSNEISWKNHSPNVMFARQSINFEKEEHMNHQIDYEGSLKNETKTLQTCKSTTEPRKNIERFRLHGFIIKVFHDGDTSGEIDDGDIEEVIKNLTTKLELPDKEPGLKDDLDACVSEMLAEIKTDEHSDSILEEEALMPVEEDVCEELSGKKKKSVNQLASIDIIQKGIICLKKLNLNEMRLKMKKRQKRFERQQEKTHNAIISKEKEATNQLSTNNTINIITPAFR